MIITQWILLLIWRAEKQQDFWTAKRQASSLICGLLWRVEQANSGTHLAAGHRSDPHIQSSLLWVLSLNEQKARVQSAYAPSPPSLPAKSSAELDTWIIKAKNVSGLKEAPKKGGLKMEKCHLGEGEMECCRELSQLHRYLKRWWVRTHRVKT